MTRRTSAVVAHTLPATAAINAANRIVLGPPRKFNSGTIPRQASAPPQRSAPYKRGMCPDSRAKMMENCRPVRKKGMAEAM